MRLTLPRLNHILIFCILTVLILYFGKQILIPVTFACMLAMLMAPLCRKLDAAGWPRALSSFLCVFILLITLLGVLTVISLQVASFTQDLPKLEGKATDLFNRFQAFVENQFNISSDDQLTMAKKQLAKLGESAGAYLGVFVSGLAGVIGNLILTLILTFLMLFGKEKYESFFIKLYKEEDTRKIKSILGEITKVSQQYLTGRAISMSIQAVLFSTGLLIIGIENAILLGCIAALLTIIPYAGPLVGGMFPVVMSLITEDSIQPTLWVVVMLIVIQMFDNNFIEPNVVGGKVKLSALATILVLIVGGTLWGIVGMILFIPLLGITKIIFDHVDELKPYGFLIGDPDEKKTSLPVLWFNKLFGKAKKK